VAEIDAALREQGIFGGKDLSRSHPELGQSALYCVTEVHSQADVDRLAQALEEVTR
jgi:glycine dehydrogenase subunit 1